MPETLVIPVEDAAKSDWNPQSFWHEPWGKSGVHKGIDIFSPHGKRLNSASSGLVLFSGSLSRGGNVVLILGPQWKLHYYAHMDQVSVTGFDILFSGESIGTVGDSGNAKGKPPHLHYSMVTIIPYIWRVDMSTQGWKKMFYLNPGTQLTD